MKSAWCSDLQPAFFGGLFLISVDALTQSLTPNYIRGRVFGLRSMLNTVGTVVVNLLIWQLPSKTADVFVIWGLAVTAGVLLVIAAIGAYTQLVNGPFDSKRTTVVWRLIRIFMMIWHRLTWIGRHNVPSSGALVIASNHTAAIDPMLIQCSIQRQVRWLMLRSYRYKFANVVWSAVEPICIEPDGKNTSS